MTDQSSCRIAPKSRHTTDRALYQQGCCRFVTKRFLATGPAADPGQPRDQDGAPGKFLPLPSITARLKFTLVCRKTQPPVSPPSRGLSFSLPLNIPSAAAMHIQQRPVTLQKLHLASQPTCPQI